MNLKYINMNIKRFFNILLNKKKIESTLPLSDDEFYEELFIKNTSWNSKTPNNDELKRWEIIERHIKQIISETKNNIKILDLGSGRGWLTNLISNYGSSIGVEPVSKVVDYARSLYPHLKFIAGSTTKMLGLGYGGQFQLIVSSEVIEHISNNEKPKFIADIYKLLSSKGYCIITTPRQEVQEEWNRYVSANQPVEDWISEEELRDLFESNGFKQLDSSRIPLKQKQSGKYFDVYQVALFRKNK